jgi:hypothetical protein
MVDLKTSDTNERFRKNFLGMLDLKQAPEKSKEKPINKKINKIMIRKEIKYIISCNIFSFSKVLTLNKFISALYAVCISFLLCTNLINATQKYPHAELS